MCKILYEAQLVLFDFYDGKRGNIYLLCIVLKEVFVRIYRYLSQRKVLTYTAFFVCLAFFSFFASRLQFDSDLSSMMPSNALSSKAQEVLTKNKAMDRLVVSVANTDTNQINGDLVTAYIEDFATAIDSLDDKNLIASVQTRQDDEQLIELFDVVNANLPFLLNEKDYLSIDSLIKTEQIRKTLQSNFETLAGANGLAMKQLIAKDPLGISLLAFKKLYQLKFDEDVQLYDGYIANANYTRFTFFIYPSNPASNTGANQGLEKLIETTKNKVGKNSEYKNLTCHAFGAHMVAAGNAGQMKADTILTLSITIILLVLLFLFFFRTWLSPFQIMIPVLFGGLFGMCMMYFARGTVSLIALGASSVILGIAVNYSLHFMSHLKHAQNKVETIRALTQPMTIGSFTTVFAFLSLTFVHTPVLQQLGLFAAFNLIGSSICTLVFLPHFVKEHNANFIPTFIDKIGTLQPNKSKWVVITIALLTIVMSFFVNKVQFNEDLMTMNFMSKSLQESQQIINERNTES
nr:MMPL family transporter [Chitinophagaceae bacterium]